MSAPFYEDIFKGNFWFSVVLVGILINIVSPLIVKGASHILLSVSSRWRAHIQKEAVKYAAYVTKLSEDHSLLAVELLKLSHHRITGITVLVVGFGLTGMVMQVGTLAKVTNTLQDARETLRAMAFGAGLLIEAGVLVTSVALFRYRKLLSALKEPK